MPPKLKAKKGNAPKSSKKGKSAAEKRPLSPVQLATKEMWITVNEEEPSLKTVMALLRTMSSRMGVYEKRLKEVISRTTAQVCISAPIAPSTSMARDGGITQNQSPLAPKYRFLDVAEEVMTGVANRLRTASALLVHQTRTQHLRTS